MLTNVFLDSWEDEIRDRYGLRLFTLDIHEGDIRLGMIAVARGEEGQGRGSDALRALCSLADEHGYRIVLTATTERLRLFYRRFGFVENVGPDRDRHLRSRMKRDPR